MDESKFTEWLLRFLLFVCGLIVGLVVCINAHGQAMPAGEVNGGTRTMISSEIGTASGLGYKLPHLSVGLATETPLGKPVFSGGTNINLTRWEADSAVFWSPDRKYITGDGESVLASGSVLWWANQTLSLTAGLRYGHLWTSQFQKSDWYPTAGIVLRDRWFGLPGRFYAVYIFPTGCQWNPPPYVNSSGLQVQPSPCTIQSNRLSGIEGYQEIRQYGHWRLGIRAAWLNFANQANPNDRAAGRVWNNTGTVSVVIRYEFRAGSLDVAY